jgi:hypothetical protein
MGKPDPAAAAVVEPGRQCALQPTLVHEAYLRLMDQTQIPARNHTQFFAIALNLMRQILVNPAKRHRRSSSAAGTRWSWIKAWAWSRRRNWTW